MARVADIGRGQEGSGQEWRAQDTVLALFDPLDVTRQGTEMGLGGLHGTSLIGQCTAQVTHPCCHGDFKATLSQGLTGEVRDYILS